MRSTITVTEAARNFAEFINRVAFGGERFTLLRGSRPVAELGPVPAGRRLAELPELLSSLPRLSPDEAERFGHDVDEARADIGPAPAADPWTS